MIDLNLMTPFMDYLKPSDGITPTCEIGLVDEAPQEAVDAYKKYQEYEEERVNSEEEWE